VAAAVVVVGEYAGHDAGTAGLLPALRTDERFRGAAGASFRRGECGALPACSCQVK
jgi:hypothetical protein